MNPTIEQTPFQRAMSIFSCPQNQFSENQLLAMLGTILARGVSNIPYHNQQVITYIGSTNNIEKIEYKLNGTTVATQSFTYVGSGAADDDKIATVTIE